LSSSCKRQGLHLQYKLMKPIRNKTCINDGNKLILLNYPTYNKHVLKAEKVLT
jgi:hypothetical protein